MKKQVRDEKTRKQLKNKKNNEADENLQITKKISL